MKIAIISDIHGNSWALNSVLSDIQKRGIVEIYDLGDSLYGPLDPLGTYKLIIDWKIKSICGNEDRIIFENTDTKTDNFTLNYVINELTNEAIDWLQKLPQSAIINDKIFMCHGTPENDSEYLIEQVHRDFVGIKPVEMLDEILENIIEKIVLCGHSHVSRIVETTEKIIINPGSVGLSAYDDDFPIYHKMENFNSLAKYCIIDVDEKIKIEQIAIPYNYEEAAQKAEENQRNDWAKWIRNGIV